ncbi:MAG: OmpA family protein [Deltaproteobacteria bacterium]|jgi:outer membrane protein OmpA-like peptidoglycan-associated protein|nr:OmpA family protein [Deltaproteobacteria bacterium]MBW2532086.1 OmpA family protein [Deltaproteobacteria bacterium]
MRKTAKIAVPVRPQARTALPLLAASAGAALTLTASSALAQQPPPPGYDQPGFAPPPAAPMPPGGQPGAPAPGTFGDPAEPGAPPGPGGGFQAEGSVQFGLPPMGAAPPMPEEEEEDEWAERERSLSEQINLLGSTGMLRTSTAGSGAAGTFRVGFLFDWFTTGGFLCNDETPCAPVAAGQTLGDEDDASHVGAFFALNVTPLSFLEAYAGIRTYANSNDHGSPQLLQVLGDTTLGVKAFLPDEIGDVMNFGGEFRLLLLNGAGDVGIAGGGTSAEFLALSTADFRKPRGKGFPLRLNLNLGYRLDNSGNLVEDVEMLRADRDPATAGDLDRIPISRIERYGLGINRVDFFKIYFGVDVPFDYVQPYVEYTVDIPVNRQSYECHTRTISPGDVCLALAELDDPNSGSPGYSAAPSRLSLGVKATPFSGRFRGLSGHLGLDIGLSATSTFIEEVAPQAPWTLYIGMGYAFDTQEKKVEAPAPLPPPPPPAPPPQYFARGSIKEMGTDQTVAGAIITIEGMPEPPVASAADGTFLSRELAPGSYNLAITAEGYKPGSCPITVAPAMQQPMPGQAPMGPPGMPPMAPGYGPQPMGPPGMPPAPGQPPYFEPAPAPSGPIYVDVECQLEALPRKGDVQGAAADAEGGNVGGASIELTDAAGNVHTASTGTSGSFAFKDLAPGPAKVKAEADGYMLYVGDLEVRPRETTQVTVTMNKRPKIAQVRVIGNQIRLTRKIHFETDSSKIKGDSNALLAEVADVLHRNPNLRKVEIQGHTDNTGGAAHNEQLSQARADAVRTWLSGHGIDPGRLEAKGYGQGRPLVPNITPANRARNRRVQFVIKEKD